MGSLHLEEERSVVPRTVCFTANVYAVRLPKPGLKRNNCGVLKSSDIFSRICGVKNDPHYKFLLIIITVSFVLRVSSEAEETDVPSAKSVLLIVHIL
jgi:hypothetical protein